MILLEASQEMANKYDQRAEGGFFSEGCLSAERYYFRWQSVTVVGYADA